MREDKVYYSNSDELFYDETEARINDEIAVLKNKSAEIFEQIHEIQDSCSHNHMTIKARSDTGNYCRSDDEYWYEADCRACGKHWHVDQSEDSIVSRRRRSDDRRVIIAK